VIITPNPYVARHLYREHLVRREAAAAILVHRPERSEQRGAARGARVALLEAPSIETAWRIRKSPLND
jgi:hypothetical protein